jgi:uncharacterized damage-inducible protein DinB
MNRRLTELAEYLDEAAASLRAAFEAVPAEKRAVRPAPERWSPAEVVHHVTIVERGMTQRIGALIEEAKKLDADRDESSVLTTIDTATARNRARRIVTSERAQPKDTDVTRVWPDYETARDALRQVLAGADGAALGAVSAQHPALGPLNGWEWIAFVGSHTARHAEQIREGSAT